MAANNPFSSFVWGRGGARLTPEELARQREYEARILAKGVDTSPAASNAEGFARVANALVGAFRRGALDKADATNRAEDATNRAPLEAFLNQSLGLTPPTPTAAGEVAATAPGSYPAAPVTADGEVADYIRQSATARGIDPNIALRVALSEGGVNDPVRQSDFVKNGVREPSYGPFQLYFGGGLGNKGLAAGIDARDPNQWRQGVDFALDQARQGGWGPWYGAKKIGVTGMQGIGALPQQTEVAQAAPQTATDAIAAQSPVAPQTGYRDPMITTAYRAPTPVQSAPIPPVQQQAAPAVDGAQPFTGDLVTPDLVSESLYQAPPPPQTAARNQPQQAAPQQVAQAVAPQMPQAPQIQTVPPQILAQAIKASQSPYASDQTKAIAAQLIKRQQEAQAAQQAQNQFVYEQQYKAWQDANDPAKALELQLKQAQLQNLTNKTANLVNAGNGNLYDPTTQTWIRAPENQEGAGNLFGGNAVDAQAINGLVKRGIITEEQGLALAAGKTVSDPTTGAIQFLTPQAIFGNSGQQRVDLFGDGSQAEQPSNNGMITLSGNRAPTEGQANAAGFSDRMINANNTISQLETVGTDKEQQLRNNIPLVGNYLTSDDFQSYDRAKRDFINAQLRRESGAAIGPDEYASADKQYFPQPGDKPQALRDKAEARRLAIQAMNRSAGPSYQAPEQVVVSDDIRAARDAIRKGADRAKVIERLQSAGIDTTGL